MENRSEEDLAFDIYDGIYLGKQEIVERDLTSKNANAMFGEQNWIHHSVLQGNTKALVHLVETCRAHIDAQTLTVSMKKDQTCLHIAAEKGNKDMAKYLLEKGINKNLKDSAGKLAHELTEDEELRDMILNYKSK